MKGHLKMSRKELRRKSLLELVECGHMSLAEAARRMEVSYRQALRIRARFVSEGDDGLVHRNRGRASNRAKPGAFRDKVVQRLRIPTIPPCCSEGRRPVVPKDSGRVFRVIAATCSE